MAMPGAAMGIGMGMPSTLGLGMGHGHHHHHSHGGSHGLHGMCAQTDAERAD